MLAGFVAGGWGFYTASLCVMILRTELGDVSVINEPTYTFGSSDNVRSYPFEKNLDSESSPVSVHGVFLNENPIAVFGATGGASGVHEHSAVFHNGRLYLAVSDSVVCLVLQPFEFKWALCIDTATCFGVHVHEPTDSLISHGELEIARFTENGEILWQSSGRNIFTGSLVLGEESVAVTDFNGDQYRFRYSDGRYDV